MFAFYPSPEVHGRVGAGSVRENEATATVAPRRSTCVPLCHSRSPPSPAGGGVLVRKLDLRREQPKGYFHLAGLELWQLICLICERRCKIFTKEVQIDGRLGRAPRNQEAEAMAQAGADGLHPRAALSIRLYLPTAPPSLLRP
ncbi:unnamed protein product [Urochloa humidicola]